MAEESLSSYAKMAAAMPPNVSRPLEPAMALPQTIDDFVSECKEYEDEKLRLRYVLNFAEQVKRGQCEDLLASFRKRSSEERGRLFKRLARYCHPDKYNDTASSDETKQLNELFNTLTNTAQNVVKNKEGVVDQAQAQKEVRDFVKNFHPKIDESIKKTEQLSAMEEKCFQLLMYAYDNLSQETVIKLLCTYVSILTYLVNWAAEYELDWIVSKKNMEVLGQHLSELMPLIQKYGLEEEFNEALKISSDKNTGAAPAEKSGEKRSVAPVKQQRTQREIEDAKAISQLVAVPLAGELVAAPSPLQNFVNNKIALNEQRIKKNAGDAKKDLRGLGINIVVTAVTTAVFASNPVGWGLAIAAFVVYGGKYMVDRERRKAKEQDRLKYYDVLFDSLKAEYAKDAQQVYLELDCVANVMVVRENLRILMENSLAFMGNRMQELELSTQAEEGHADNYEELDILREEIKSHPDFDKLYLSLDEKTQLLNLGFSGEDFAVENTEMLRENLRLGIDEEEVDMLRLTLPSRMRLTLLPPDQGLLSSVYSGDGSNLLTMAQADSKHAGNEDSVVVSSTSFGIGRY